MRPAIYVGAVCAAVALTLALIYADSRKVSDRSQTEPPASEAASSVGLGERPPPRPIPSEIVAIERSIQARSLRLSPQAARASRVVLGKGVLGQLTSNGLRVHSTSDGSALAEVALDAPRELVALADGALLALDSQTAQRVEPGKKPVSFPRPMLLPGVQVHADAVQADRIWIFDPNPQQPTLSSFRLAAGDQAVLLPEQVIELESPRGGVFGVTREGVWLYFGPGRAERFGPGGARLSRLVLPELAPSFLLLPTRRLDMSYLLADDGRLTRALVTPTFKKLAEVELGLTVFNAAVGDEGRLLAVLAVVGAGPRFELCLFDADLEPMGRVALPAAEPTGREDWVQVATRNLGLSVAAREPLVAVGGPERALIFDGRGKQVLSIPSR